MTKSEIEFAERQREKLVLSVCNATQKTNYKCEFNCEKKGKCAYCLVIAEQMITHGVTVQEWIPVSERLPEEGKWVLMADKYGLGVDMAKVSNDCVRTRDGDVGGIDVYTHWMPLPQPPKGELQCE